MTDMLSKGFGIQKNYVFVAAPSLLSSTRGRCTSPRLYNYTILPRPFRIHQSVKERKKEQVPAMNMFFLEAPSTLQTVPSKLHHAGEPVIIPKLKTSRPTTSDG